MTELPRTGTAVVAHPGTGSDGSDRLLLETVGALLERDWRVVLSVPVSDPLAAEAISLGAEVIPLEVPAMRKRELHPFRLPGYLARSTSAASGIDAVLRRVEPDVLYVSTIMLPLWTVRARAHRIPVVVHLHESERQMSAVLRRAREMPLAMATSIVVHSASSRNRLVEAMPRLASRSVVVHDGVPGPAAPTPARSDLTGGLRVVYLGRLSRRNGPDIAIDAIHLLSGLGVSATLDLVGETCPGDEGYERQLREQTARLGLDAVVMFRGPHSGVWEALADADAAVVPSRLEEPFDVTAVEAVLAGRPVAVSAIGGLAEAIDGFASAIPVDPGDPAALATALHRISDQWSAFRRTAEAMAPAAAGVYAPGTYRHTIADEITRAASRSRPDSSRTRSRLMNEDA